MFRLPVDILARIVSSGLAGRITSPLDAVRFGAVSRDCSVGSRIFFSENKGALIHGIIDRLAPAPIKPIVGGIPGFQLGYAIHLVFTHLREDPRRLIQRLIKDSGESIKEVTQALWFMCERGHKDGVKILLEAGADPLLNVTLILQDDAPYLVGTALLAASSNEKRTAVLSILLDELLGSASGGSSPVEFRHKLISDMEFSLFHACHSGLHDAVRLLLGAFGRLNVSITSHVMPLEVAVRGNHLKVVRVFTDAGIDMRHVGGMALAWSHSADMAEFLIERGADVHMDDEFALRIACMFNRPGVVRVLLKAGANARIMENTCIRNAAISGSAEVVQVLIDSGVDPTVQNNEPLVEAATLGHEGVVKVLLRAGADARARNCTCLIMASARGFDSIVTLLLEAGADVHASDDEALICACLMGHVNAARTLLDAGADVHAREDTPLIWACSHGHIEIVKLLLEAGADVHAKKGMAMRMARIGNKDAVVKLLIESERSSIKE
jgi:ankyrin repeat protein